MITKSPIKRDKKYYNALGHVPQGILSSIDFYRYMLVRRHIYGNSVLDVGCARGDFLKLIKSDYQIAGIEVTKQRIEDCNRILGQDAVRLFNIEDEIDIENNCFDSVVCMEVLEHLIDPQETLKHLIRISRKRVIITVPYDEKIQWLLCTQCGKYTPLSGHLHSFDEVNIRECLDNFTENVEIIKLARFGSIFLRFLPNFFPFKLKYLFDEIFCRLFPKYSRWILLVADKNV